MYEPIQWLSVLVWNHTGYYHGARKQGLSEIIDHYHRPQQNNNFIIDPIPQGVMNKQWYPSTILIGTIIKLT